MRDLVKRSPQFEQEDHLTEHSLAEQLKERVPDHPSTGSMVGNGSHY